MSRTQTRPRSRNGNGAAPSVDALTEAVAFEQQIADQAAAIRGDEIGMTPALYLKLLPLLRRPIPQGFITHVGNVTGKPYDSTGVKSVQVLSDRMDNVLTPLAWRDHAEHHQDGKLCHVTVEVVAADGSVMVARSSWGGVDRGSTLGNVYKGSYTNAAKRAFAQIGPGHEVYVGATDLDPDVSEDAAKAQTRPPRDEQQGADRALPVAKIGAKAASQLTQALDEFCRLGGDIAEVEMKAVALGGEIDMGPEAPHAWHQMTRDQGLALFTWMGERIEEMRS